MPQVGMINPSFESKFTPKYIYLYEDVVIGTFAFRHVMQIALLQGMYHNKVYLFTTRRHIRELALKLMSFKSFPVCT